MDPSHEEADPQAAELRKFLTGAGLKGRHLKAAVLLCSEGLVYGTFLLHKRHTPYLKALNSVRVCCYRCGRLV